MLILSVLIKQLPVDMHKAIYKICRLQTNDDSFTLVTIVGDMAMTASMT